VSSDQSSGSFIVLTSSVTQTKFTATTLVAGKTYSFKVEARNSFGYSAFSEIASILCATVPSTPTTPSTHVEGGDVIVSWVLPRENGLAITSYTITIETSTGTFESELTHCDGSSASIVAAV